MREGDPIGGYRLLRRIGEGGMGVVWMAEHGVLGRRAAIKILHPEHSTRDGVVTRFFNEARAATAISDPGIIQIFDVGRHADRAYIVMELLDGEPLDARLRRVGVLPVGNALRLCRQVASAIGAAHARGIVHRDLKPENIFIVRDAEVAGGERAKVLDFGIAKLADHLGVRSRTNASAIIGTPPYMSPEQCRGAGHVDSRSDLYSLGCVLYALVVGHPPFESSGAGVLIMQHLSDPPPRPSSCAPGVPPEVDELILRCLAKRPDDRFQSGAELAGAIDGLAALASAVTAQPVARPAPISEIATTLGASASYVTPPTIAAPPGRRLGRLTGLIAVAVVGTGTLGLTVFASRHRPDALADVLTPAPGDREQGAAVPPPATVDPRPAQARAALRALLAAFPRWAAEHPGAACPTSAALGGGLDPWGRAYELTCTDQPADQVVGARSRGPDGAVGTDDDLVSWTLDDAMKLARGARWITHPVVAPSAPIAPAPATAGSPPHKPAGRPPVRRTGEPPASDGIIDLDGDGIPDSR